MTSDLRSWIVAGAAMSMALAARPYDADDSPRYRRSRQTKPKAKTADQLKRAAKQKAQRQARKRNRK